MKSESIFSRFPLRIRRTSTAAFIFLAYFTLAKAGLLLATLNSSVSPIWPASGFAIAVLFKSGRKYWPAIAAAALLANLLPGRPLHVAATMSLGSVLAALVGSTLFTRAYRKKRILVGVEALFGQFLAALFATSISATFGTAALLFSGVIDKSSFGTNWFTWWVGDTLGVFLFVPFFLRLFLEKKPFQFPRSVTVLASLFTAGLTVYIFKYSTHHISALFTIYPLILLSVWLLKPAASSFIVVIISSAAIWSTAASYGPFNIGTTNENLLCLSLFIVSVAITEQSLQFINDLTHFRYTKTVLLTGWIIGAVILNGFARKEADIDHSRFQKLVNESMARIHQRVSLNESALRGGIGLFLASNEVTVKEWKSYVNALNLDRNYPGIHGIGYIIRVPKSKVEAFNRKMRQQGQPDFKIHALNQQNAKTPLEEMDAHYVIAATEPMSRNSIAVGLDIATESNRLEGALRAAKTDLPEVTLPIRLVQDHKNRLGFLLFLPIYKTEKLFGWVYSPLIIQDFLGSVPSTDEQDLAVEMAFAGSQSSSEILFSEGMERIEKNNAHSLTLDQPLWGQTMRFTWHQTNAFQSRHDITSAWVIFICAFLNVFLAAFVAILTSMTRKVSELAERQSEEIRNQRAKLEHSNRLAALGEMAAGVAHEINNPLAILAGRAVILAKLSEQENIPGDLIRQNTVKIRETINRMAKIISGLHQFSRNAEKDPFFPAEVEKIISSSVNFAGERFKNRNIDIRISPIPDLTLVCREVQIVQILLNLLNNSFDAVTSETDRWIGIDVEVRPDDLLISVTDSGAEIPKDVASNMMNPFFTTKLAGKGTGLGLTISSRIAEDHGGSLHFDSESENTRFVLTISRNLVSG